MATFGRSQNASDEIFDLYCSPCMKKGKNKEAVKYCTECQEYLCENCVENHNSFSALAGHKLVGKTQFGKSTSKTDSQDLPSVPTEICKVHAMKLVDMYCAEHDAVGCHICFAIYHKPCHDIHYIPEYVQTTPQTDLNRNVYGKLQKVMSKLENMIKRSQKAKADNDNAKMLCLNEIKAFRAEINQTLDRLEQAAIAETEKKYNTLQTMYQEDIKKIQDSLDNLSKCKVAMELSAKNASQQFVTAKICASIISENEKHTDNRVDLREDRLTFTKNLQLLSFLQTLNSLGLQLKKVVSKEKFNVKLHDDKSDCTIWSSCILDSGYILLADMTNKNIKLVDSKTFIVKNSKIMPAAPSSVCRVNSREAAVSLNNRTVQFVSVDGEISLTRSLKFGHCCGGIAVMDCQLVVSVNGPSVYMYTMDGTRLKTIEKDGKGNDIFSHAREICVSDDGKKIHVADLNKGVITIDIDGNVIWKYSGSELKNTLGVCTDGSGNIFVSGFSSHNVVQIGPDGQYMGEVVSATYGQNNPQAVCFDRKNSKLLVTFGNELELHVFEVK